MVNCWKRSIQMTVYFQRSINLGMSFKEVISQTISYIVYFYQRMMLIGRSQNKQEERTFDQTGKKSSEALTVFYLI